MQVENRSEIEKQRQTYTDPVDIVLDPDLALRFARDFGTKAFIMGALSFEGNDRLRVRLNAYRTDNGKGIEGLQISLLLSDEIKRLWLKTPRPTI